MKQDRNRVALWFRAALFILSWGALAWYQASHGHAVIATLVALPVVAVALALLSPLRGPGHFALTQELGVSLDSSLTPRQRELQKALWWLLGACLAPLGALLVLVIGATGWLEEGHGMYVVLGGLVPLVGIGCLLKAIGAFFAAWSATYRR